MIYFHASSESHELSSTEDGWAKLSLEEKCLVLLDNMDGDRIDEHGGYPSEYVFKDGKICVATIAYDGSPELIFATMADFVNEKD